MYNPQVAVSAFHTPHNSPLNKMVLPKHKNNSKMSSQELQEVRNMARRLRQVKRQMFLKQVEAPTPVDTFRSLIMNLAVEEEAREAVRSRSNSLSSEGSSSRSSSFDNSCTVFNGSLRSIGDLNSIEE